MKKSAIPQRLNVMTYAQLAQRVMRLEDALEKCANDRDAALALTAKTINHLIKQIDIACAERDAATQRGDTYRRRALALRQQSRMWRNTSEYNREEADYLKSLYDRVNE